MTLLLKHVVHDVRDVWVEVRITFCAATARVV